MGLFSRFVAVVKANINALIGAAEDPSKLIEQTLVDMQVAFQRTKEAVTKSIADEKRLLAQLEGERKLAQEWEQRAMLAVNEGRDDLATEALNRHATHTESAQQLHTAWSAHAAEVKKLKQALRDMSTQLEELKRRKNVLTARQTRVEAKTTAQGALSAMKDGSGLDTFQRMTDKIEAMEANAAAAEELANDLRTDDVEQQFKDLERRGNADQRLLALKQRMALSTGASAPRSLPAQSARGATDSSLVIDVEGETKPRE